MILAYLKYLLQASRRGHGIHSPYLFELLEYLYNPGTDMSDLARIYKYRQELIRSRDIVIVEDLGAGSKLGSPVSRSVSQIARYASVRRRYGWVLYLLARRFKPGYILELGTALGISSSCLGLGFPGATVTTVEGSESLVKLARKTLVDLRVENVEVLHSRFDKVLTELPGGIPGYDMVFLDGHHLKEATLKYFDTLLDRCHEESVMILDDIHWSRGMNQAWKEIISRGEVKVSIDLYQLGILLFKPELSKQDFVVRI